MDSRWQPVIGQPLQHVANIDHQGPGGRIGGNPDAIAGQQLQPGFFRAEQQRDQIDIAVRSGADRLAVLPVQRRIMQQPHHRIALFDPGVEPVLAQPQIRRDPRQDGGAGRIELAVELAEHFLEFIRPRGPDIGRHRQIGQRAARRQIAPDVPEFLEVMRLGVLGDLDPERGIAARTSNRRIVVAALFRFGQGKKLLGQLPGPRDQISIDAEVLDQREAERLEALADILRKPGLVIGQRKNGEFIEYHWWTGP